MNHSLSRKSRLNDSLRGGQSRGSLKTLKTRHSRKTRVSLGSRQTRHARQSDSGFSHESGETLHSISSGGSGEASLSGLSLKKNFHRVSKIISWIVLRILQLLSRFS